MLVTPSEDWILHGHSTDYNSQILNDKHNDNLSPMGEKKVGGNQFYLDYVFMFYIGENLQYRRSLESTISILTRFVNESSKDIPLFFGLLAQKYNDPQSALKFYKIAATMKSLHAMNAIGMLYQEYPSLSYKKNSSFFDNSLKWFKRAMMCGSIDSIRNIGYLYRMQGDNIKSLYYYLKHYRITSSVLSAKQCAELLEMQGEHEASLKMYQQCIYYGDSQSIKPALILLDSPKLSNIKSKYDMKLSHVIKSFGINPIKEFTFSEYMKANLKNDFSLPPFSSVTHSLEFADKFGHIDNTQDIIQRNISVSYSQYDYPHSNTYDPSSTSKSFYPSSNKNRLLMIAFDFASRDINERNLNICLMALNSLSLKSPKGITESQIWQSRIKNTRKIDFAPCGFISYLIGDHQLALKLFEKGSKRGCKTCSLMTGIMYFHGVGTERDVETGSYYLSSCMTDPLALLHISVVHNDRDWAERASTILKMDMDSGEMYEWAGDEFAEGIHVPESLFIASMWYGFAFKKYQDNNQDIVNIMNKIWSIKL